MKVDVYESTDEELNTMIYWLCMQPITLLVSNVDPDLLRYLNGLVLRFLYSLWCRQWGPNKVDGTVLR